MIIEEFKSIRLRIKTFAYTVTQLSEMFDANRNLSVKTYSIITKSV